MRISGLERESGAAKTIKFIPLLDTSDNYNRISSNEASKEVCPLIDFTQMGKHYRVKTNKTEGKFSDELPGISRHYSEAFCMRKNVYENILKLVENPQDADATQKIVDEVKMFWSNVCLTIKDYKTETGLSNLIHNDISA